MALTVSKAMVYDLSMVIWQKYGCLFFACCQVQLVDKGFHKRDTNPPPIELALRATLLTKSLVYWLDYREICIQQVKNRQSLIEIDKLAYRRNIYDFYCKF